MSSPHKTRWAWSLSTFFGIGYLKPGPGTYGSVAAVLLWYITAHAFHLIRPDLALLTGIVALVLLFAGIHASTLVARESARKDPGFIVIDEVVGQLIALIAVRSNWQHALISLILFRLFDIFKPWPIRLLEALPEGLGIMLDDVAAGVLAFLCAQLIALVY
jgi:phosphatidylglycerophosphatase A